MATKQKYTNRVRATIWNKSLRMDTEDSIPAATVTMFEMINTTEDKERALAWMQQHLEKCKEREARHADVQALKEGD
ncbi:hypothetical protein ACQSEB_17785 [Salmonella enterica]|uniref:hypothetical protein n=1 Tax=Salmonella enterica TaxID=28901 RepID=UPI003D3172BF